MWHSRGIGGRSALDYLIKVKEMDFYDAVRLLSGEQNLISCAQKFSTPDEKPPKVFELPKKNSDNRRVEMYLLSRGIHPDVIKYCISLGLLYEEKNHHNAVFVGFDENNIPVHASFRAANDKRIMGDVAGSNKAYAFQLHAAERNTSVHVFECAIDLLSYATILKLYGKDFTKENLLSLDGIDGTNLNEKHTPKIPAALEKYLENYPETDEVILHLDNDEAGRNATKKVKNLCDSFVKTRDSPPVFGKDVNEFLVGILTKSERKIR